MSGGRRTVVVAPEVMGLRTLTVADLRNIKDEQLEFSPHLNIIHGENGSGKTSLLEAVYVLGMGRSFRTPEIRHVISRGAARLMVVGGVSGGRGDGVFTIGLSRTPTKTEIKIGGDKVKRLATLAAYLPVMVVTPHSHKMIESERRHRREYVDWGLFHVEQGFYEHWRTYANALRQRNAALKERLNDRSCYAWDRVLIESGAEIDGYRTRYVTDLTPFLRELSETLVGMVDIRFCYERGWPDDGSFESALVDARAADRRLGRTTVGPHRADLRVTVAGMDALAVVSRGQQKLLVYSMKLAQIRHLRAQREKSTVLLLDDLAAELDADRRNRLLASLKGDAAQVFVTTTDIEALAPAGWPGVKLFHVEQGRFRESFPV